jgi:hypothetical protein
MQDMCLEMSDIRTRFCFSSKYTVAQVGTLSFHNGFQSYNNYLSIVTSEKFLFFREKKLHDDWKYCVFSLELAQMQTVITQLQETCGLELSSAQS